MASVSRAVAGQQPPLEGVRAAQNALRTDSTVTVTVGPGRSVPPELQDRARAMPIHPGEALAIRNDSGAGLWLRFVDEAGATRVDQTIAVAAGETRTLSPDALSRLAGKDRFLAVAIADLAADAAPAATLWFVIESGTPTDQQRATDAQISAAQAGLARTPVTKPQPGARPSAPEVVIDVGSKEPDVAFTKKSRPLPIEQIRIDGSLVGERLRLTTSDGARTVRFKRDDGTEVPQSVLPGAGPNAGTPIDYRKIVDWAGRDGDLSFTVSGGPTEYQGFLTINVSPLESGVLIVPIDLTGVSDWRFVNPRSPARIGPVRPGVTAPSLVFVNRVPGRTIKVAFPPFKQTAGDLEQKFRDAGFEVDCSRPDTCAPELVLQAANRTVRGDLLIEAYGGPGKEGLVVFNVSFFEGDVEPANPLGYLAVVPRPFEPAFATSWSAVGNAGYLRDAYFAGFTMNENEAAVINTATPFDDQARLHLTGNVRLSARPQLGTRANAEVDLVVKDRDFGVADSPTVTTQKARVNVFGYNGFAFSIGRYDFAAPTRSIAIAESGEGFSGRWRRYTVSQNIRPREKLDKGVFPVGAGEPARFPFSPDARERWSTLAQAQMAPGWLRIEASALTGRRKTLSGLEGYYFTWGGDVMAASGFGGDEPKDSGTTATTSPASASKINPAVWRLNGGFYASQRQARASAVNATAGDHGWAALIDGTIAWLNGRTPQWTVGATAAMASRDDPTTPQNEGYAGESAAFVPDKIFLATLAGKVATLVNVDANGVVQTRTLSGGLMGKKYLGVGFVYQGFSPLVWIARAVAVPRSDMGTSSITGRWHGYGLRNPISTTAGQPARDWLGQEWSMEWLLETPRGVRYTLNGAYFAPGELLKIQRLILSSTWYLDARVTVTLR